MKNSETPPSTTASQQTIQSAERVLDGQGRKGKIARLLPFLGPAFVASVAYVDPGNFATNIQGGAEFGYTLLWVIVASNLVAMLIQTTSAKLGIATGRNLAELCRERFPRPVVWILWLLMELVAMATDLAEFIGAALGFNLLLHVPLWLGGLLTAVATFLILSLERRGFRPLEAVIAVLVTVVAACYLLETVLQAFFGKLSYVQILFHAVVPQFSGKDSFLLATGILGATVMPHAIFLHSALTQGRIVVRDPQKLKRLFRYEVLDVGIAMSIAGFVNASMLIMAAATFHQAGLHQISRIETAYHTLEPLLGSAASTIFAVSLLASGLSSASVGTMSGQVIMQGFIKRHVPSWLRRLITMGPSLLVILLGLDPTRTLIISQVILSFGLPFTLIPLALFSQHRDIMGVLVNRKVTTLLLWLISALVILLNLFLIDQSVRG